MKFSQIERGINNFSDVSRGDQKFNRVFHPVSTAPPCELKNDNSLTTDQSGIKLYIFEKVSIGFQNFKIRCIRTTEEKLLQPKHKI